MEIDFCYQNKQIVHAEYTPQKSNLPLQFGKERSTAINRNYQLLLWKLTFKLCTEKLPWNREGVFG